MSTLFTKVSFFLGVLLSTINLVAEAQVSATIVPGGPSVCAGTELSVNITGILPPYTYKWSNGATTATIILNQSANIRVHVRGFSPNGGRRCANSARIPFTVVANPVASVSPAGPIKLCQGQSVILTANGGQTSSTYLWNTGATTASITVNASGTYQVTITNSTSGCNSSSTSNAVNVEVLASSFQPVISSNGPLTVCKPGTISLFADPGFSSYQWSTGATTPTISVLMDGSQLGAVLDTLTVTLTVSLNNQCSFTNSDGVILRSVRQPRLRAVDCGNLNLTMNDSIRSEVVLSHANEIQQYEFEFEESTNPGIFQTYISNSRWCKLSNLAPFLQPSKFYNVRVRVIIDGTPYCYGQICQIGIVPVTPFVQPSGSRLAASNSTLNASVFPNPSADEFQVVLRNMNADQPTLVNVNDLSGRVVSSFIVDSATGTVRFGSELKDGIYTVSIRQGDYQTTTRIVKTK
jgi:hypothetical protein